MYKLLLCVRYLRTRYIALASIVSVMLGVATMIVVNSVMAGFSTEMRDRIHGILADIIVETNSLDGATDADYHLDLARRAAGDSIAGMTATIEVYGMLSFQYGGQYVTRPVTLIGITPEGKASVGPLKEYLDSYQSIRDDHKKEIRGPLRDASVPPGWELTGAAQIYRRQLKARQQWMRDIYEDDADKAHSEPEFLEPDGIQPVSNEQAANDDAAAAEMPATASKSKAAAEPQFMPDEPVKHIGPGNHEGPLADDSHPLDRKSTFDPSDLFAPGTVPTEPGAPSDLDGPLDGRLYVGMGLVSFPYEETDPTTGITSVQQMVMVRPGDDVKISTVTAGRPPDAVHFNATVVDLFKSGMSEYDSNLVFCNIEYLQKMRAMIDPETGARSITSIQIKLKEGASAQDVVRQLQAVFPPGLYTVRTWEEKQGPLLAAVEVESAILNVLLFMIIAVAGFGILAIFFMIVVEKTRDIGILKALGASSKGVMSIFLSYGLGLGVVGSGVGVVIGLLFVRYINEIEAVITWLTGRKVFDQRIYYFPTIPTSVNLITVTWVALGAMAIAVLASILPARRAARLHPVQALRYE